MSTLKEHCSFNLDNKYYKKFIFVIFIMYHLYIVKFDNHTFDENELNNQYTDDSIKLI
jgi:hypothetical protein